MVDFDNELFNSFYGRTLVFEDEQMRLEGEIPLMIASKKNNSFYPYLLFNIFEYDEKLDNEPMGELLSAMFITQKLNKTSTTYGIYILCQMWFFVILKENKYYISSAFDINKEKHLQSIFKMLKAQKEIIFEMMMKK